MVYHKKKRVGLPKPNPYVLMTGAVAASAAAMTMGGGQEAQANHIGCGGTYEQYLIGVDGKASDCSDVPGYGGGKWYSDKEPGRPCYGLAEPDVSICYMTLTVDRTWGAESSAYDSAIAGGLLRWIYTPTTINFQTMPYYNIENDLHFKTYGLASTTLVAEAREFDYYKQLCAQGGDCDAGAAAPQRYRWWYADITINLDHSTSFTSRPMSQQQGIMAHEISHTMGLDDRDVFCGVLPSLMDHDCLLNHGIETPQNVEICSVNHAWYFPPLMYGDAQDSSGQSYAYRNCP